MWWGQGRALADERRLAYGVIQDRLPLFLDFVVMWFADYARGLFLESWNRWASTWRGADRAVPYQKVGNPPVPKTKSYIWILPVALALEGPARRSPNGNAAFNYKWLLRTMGSLYDRRGK